MKELLSQEELHFLEEKPIPPTIKYSQQLEMLA